MRKLLASIAVALLAAPLGSSCSDGSGPGGITIDTLSGVGALTGLVLSDGTVDLNGLPAAGDFDATDPQLGARAFFTFDLTSIPAGKVLRSAHLRVFQAEVVNRPYATLGDLVVDHVIYGNTLDGADYDGPEISRGFGVLSTDSILETKRLSVLQRVQADLDAGRTVSQFRVRFSIASDDDGLSDFVNFRKVGELPPPILQVTYQP